MNRLAGFELLVLCALAFSSGVSNNRQGNKAYKEKKYDEAARHYQEAEIEAPEEKAVPYNLGNALYKSGNYSGAVQALEKAKKSNDPFLKKKALFNLGNSHYRAGSNLQDPSSADQLKAALDNYKEVLKLDPSDQNAKFNLQKTLQKMEQQKQQQQNKDQNKDKDSKDNKDKKDQNQQNGKDQQSKNDQGDSTGQKDGQNEKKQGDEKDKGKEEQSKDQEGSQGDSTQQGQAPPLKPGQMSEEQARALLESLRKDEGEWQKKRMRKLAGSAKSEKDW